MTGETHEYGQDDMAHDLPRAEIVDRIEWLTAQCVGKRVVHVGFADAGFRQQQGRAGRWLHGHLHEVASELVGIDADPAGAAAAAEDGFETYVVDCTDAAAVAALGIEPADIVLAGEVIEHVGAPGPFLEALHHLCKPDGTLIVTTPNAYGLVNVVASVFRRVEVNHPDHVMMFTWRTLTELMRRSGWDHARTVTYVPSVRERGSRSRLEAAGVRLVVGCERLLGRLNRPFSADGLIVSATPADRPVPTVAE
ncbi:MAG: methyltransferase domain-containing protein [Acidimicrobiaceae bacterium]|nr:methyltransferase domain-containing protein [Acidimicrobiaceae bacterium]